MSGFHARPKNRSAAPIVAAIAIVAAAIAVVVGLAAVISFGGCSRDVVPLSGASESVFEVSDRTDASAQTTEDADDDDRASAFADLAAVDGEGEIPLAAISALEAVGAQEEGASLLTIARAQVAPAADSADEEGAEAADEAGEGDDAASAADTQVSVGGASVSIEAASADLAAYPDVAAAIDAYAEAGYDTSFVLYGFDTGTAVGYNIDRVYFCASTVKAPFSAYVLEAADAGSIDAGETLVETDIREGTGIMAFDGVSEYSLDEVVEHAIMQSDNTGYRLLWSRYGGDGFDAWAEEVGVPEDTIVGAEYPSLAVSDLARLWVGVERYVVAGSDRGTWLASLLSATDRSFLRPVADDATVLSKPGFETNTWYPGDPFDYGALHDAGVVSDEAGTWLVAVMSNADYDSNYETDTEYLIEDLIAALLVAREDFAAA